jgi:hypothetical protein
MNQATPLVKVCDQKLDEFTSKVDNFKAYKEKLFGKMVMKQMEWIDDSKRML